MEKPGVRGKMTDRSAMPVAPPHWVLGQVKNSRSAITSPVSGCSGSASSVCARREQSSLVLVLVIGHRVLVEQLQDPCSSGLWVERLCLLSPPPFP